MYYLILSITLIFQLFHTPLHAKSIDSDLPHWKPKLIKLALLEWDKVQAHIADGDDMLIAADYIHYETVEVDGAMLKGVPTYEAEPAEWIRSFETRLYPLGEPLNYLNFLDEIPNAKLSKEQIDSFSAFDLANYIFFIQRIEYWTDSCGVVSMIEDGTMPLLMDRMEELLKESGMDDELYPQSLP